MSKCGLELYLIIIYWIIKISIAFFARFQVIMLNQFYIKYSFLLNFVGVGNSFGKKDTQLLQPRKKQMRRYSFSHFMAFFIIISESRIRIVVYFVISCHLHVNSQPTFCGLGYIHSLNSHDCYHFEYRH